MNWNLSTIIIFCHDVARMVEFHTNHFSLQPVGKIDKNCTLLNMGNCNISFHEIGQKYTDVYEQELKFHSNKKLVFI